MVHIIEFYSTMYQRRKPKGGCNNTLPFGNKVRINIEFIETQGIVMACKLIVFVCLETFRRS